MRIGPGLALACLVLLTSPVGAQLLEDPTVPQELEPTEAPSMREITNNDRADWTLAGIRDKGIEIGKSLRRDGNRHRLVR